LLTLRFVKVRLTVDEQEYDREVVVLSVSNGRYFGSGINVSPQADISDGLLDVVLIHKLPRWRVPFLLPKYLKGRHLSLDVCETFRGSRISIQPYQYHSFECDGEMISASHMDISPAGSISVLAGAR
jgi:diacylglycerol kinase (ATP)